MKTIIFLFVLAVSVCSVRRGQSQPVNIVSSERKFPPGDKAGIDKDLRITSPRIGSRVNGRLEVKGKAKPNSYVNVVVTSTYFKLGIDQQKRRVFKGEGPLPGRERTLKVKANGQGVWTTPSIDFRNEGWSQQFRIVVTSVEGKNATYVVVTNETRNSLAWD